MNRSTAHKKTPGVIQPGPLWTEAELRVLDRQVKLVLAGRLPSPRQAVSPCLPDLERIGKTAHSGHVRTWEATYRALLGRIPPRFRQRYRRPPSWTPAEMRIVNRYAQAVADGKYASAGDAAEACVKSLAELRCRLEKRGEDSPEVVEQRLENAAMEMACRDEYAYRVVNNKLDEAYEELKGIILRERQP